MLAGNRKLIVIGLLLAAVCGATTLCSRHKPDTIIRDAYGQAFAGSEACRPCHGAICDAFFKTAHERDSRPASPLSVRGSFDPARSRFVYRPDITIVMQKTDSGLFQTAYHNGTA